DSDPYVSAGLGLGIERWIARLRHPEGFHFTERSTDLFLAGEIAIGYAHQFGKRFALDARASLLVPIPGENVAVVLEISLVASLKL
ncbi:MAG: hypothetical protein L0216_07070, partial [Planctomycetales bacterium]|nr:hypothetical protein [Planctomycetales bacterium]